jgi:putative membrane protein
MNSKIQPSRHAPESNPPRGTNTKIVQEQFARASQSRSSRGSSPVKDMFIHPGSISARLTLVAAALLFAPVALSAQGAVDPGNPNPSGPVPNLPASQQPMASPGTQDSTGYPGMTGQMMRDKLFLRKATEDGIAEVQCAQLAAQKSPSPDVKAFAEKMATDRTEINQQLSPLADSMGVMVPKKMTKDSQAQYEKLKALAPADFDSQYILIVTMNHRKELHDYREEIVATPDPALREELVKAGKVIRDHTVQAEQIARDKGIQLPPRPPRPAPAGTPPTPESK